MNVGTAERLWIGAWACANLFLVWLGSSVFSDLSRWQLLVVKKGERRFPRLHLTMRYRRSCESRRAGLVAPMVESNSWITYGHGRILERMPLWAIRALAGIWITVVIRLGSLSLAGGETETVFRLLSASSVVLIFMALMMLRVPSLRRRRVQAMGEVPRRLRILLTCAEVVVASFVLLASFVLVSSA